MFLYYSNKIIIKCNIKYYILLIYITNINLKKIEKLMQKNKLIKKMNYIK